MAVNIVGRKIAVMRCQVDPMIPPKPRNAFSVMDGFDMELTPQGVYVKAQKTNHQDETEFLIPFANVQSIKFVPSEIVAIDKSKKAS